MCLILFAYDCHPQYKLVVAANRDEFYNRPTLPAAFWPDIPSFLAGKDLKEGGTWMGITTSGRFAAITNYRDPSYYIPHSPSRGQLVKKYLNSDHTPVNFLENLINSGLEYNGFNLLVGNFETLYYYCNRVRKIRKITPGVHGLSNNLLDVPWPKVTKGIKFLTQCIEQDDIMAEDLFAIMADTEQPEEKLLPHTGISWEWEKILAPIFVSSQSYGTKSTTLLLVDHNKHVRFWERSFIPGKSAIEKEVFYEFDLVSD